MRWASSLAATDESGTDRDFSCVGALYASTYGGESSGGIGYGQATSIGGYGFDWAPTQSNFGVNWDKDCPEGLLGWSLSLAHAYGSVYVEETDGSWTLQYQAATVDSFGDSAITTTDLLEIEQLQPRTWTMQY